MFVKAPENAQPMNARVEELAQQSRTAVWRRTDRVFVGLLLVQWVAGIGLALWVSPLTWAGAESRTHPHVWTALFLGLAIISLPVWLGLRRPGQTLTRHVIAVGQMLSGALLIHLMGGRIETHFHVFGSLAFLAFYRDWRVLATATVIAAGDHFFRGLLWPESVYGTAVGSTWRWLEHAGWVVFIDLFLVYSCLQGDRDIRETARREAELRSAEEQFRSAFNDAAVGMALLDLEGRFLQVNRTLCEMVGYGEDELLAQNFKGLTHPDDVAGDREQVALVLGGGGARVYRREKRYLHKSGRVVWVQVIVSYVDDAAGKPHHVVSQIQDITARRDAEEESRRTREQLMDAIESLDAGFVMYDADERFVVCNNQFEATRPAGAPALAPGTPYEEILRAGHRAGVAGTGQTEDEFVTGLLAAHRAPGEPTEYRIGGRWIRVSDRRTREGGVVSLRTDVTALKQATEAAESASLAKGEFLANMSHEIRTPMNGILGFTNLLLDTDLTGDQREYLGLVKSSADALLTVINDILDFSKIEAGKLDLDPVPFSLKDELGDMLKSIALRAHEKGLELTADVRPSVPDVVIGDADRVRQILNNLVGNGIKFTAKGEVGVRVERVPTPADGDNVRLRFTVSDTGIGIPADKLKQIFDPFTQADGSTTRKYGGTGLGLTICARLVELMGGRIWVESEPGRGSEFHFEAVFGAARGSRARTNDGFLSNLRGVPVLVVDDNATNRRVLEETLRLWEAKPTCVDSGAAALAELRRAAALGEPYPLVLLDAMMPEMDGFTVAEQIARGPELAGPAVLMLTSADGQGDAARCRRIGLAGYMVKPVKSSELHRAISAALSGEARSRSAHRFRPTTETRSLRILLAEDNAVNQRVAVRMLESSGHTVFVAGNGREAVSAAAREPFDVILMDVQMPEMDGFEATAAIRAHQYATGRRVPIVAMTAHAMKGDRERCLAAGMDDYLPKPVDREDLRRVLNWAAGLSGEAPREAVSEATPPPASPAFDRATALARLGGDEELLAELAGLFREEGPRALREIGASLAAGDATGVRRTAHGLKGAAGYVGGTLTAEAAHRIELLGAAGELGSIPDALRALEAEVGRLTTALAAPTT
jgi:two-component system sensor histidine kinase/response regulator